jgi:hypothetical protein
VKTSSKRRLGKTCRRMSHQRRRPQLARNQLQRSGRRADRASVQACQVMVPEPKPGWQRQWSGANRSFYESPAATAIVGKLAAYDVKTLKESGLEQRRHSKRLLYRLPAELPSSETGIRCSRPST